MQSIIIFAAMLAGLIYMQIKNKNYIPWLYWSVIVVMAIFGTMFSDLLHHSGISLIFTTIGFLFLLLITLGIWYKLENTLDMHSITTTRREIFYWLVIFFSFALGTAAGDLFADSLNLGFIGATVTFGFIMVIVPVLLWLFRINIVVLFWVSYILTRPFGAAGGDLISHSVKRGGFGLGTGTTSLIFLSIMIIMIIYLSLTHKKEMPIGG
jgi:uncharacterized membrane-anchored protein